MEKKKRSIAEIIDSVYEYIEASGGEIYASNLREVVSNPSTVLEIIKNIQERPYLYFNSHSASTKKKTSKKPKTYTTLKLSSHRRNPKHRYVQLEEVIQYLERSYHHTDSEGLSKADMLLVLTRTIDALNRISNRLSVDSSYFL